jgi:hypothetical protein
MEPFYSAGNIVKEKYNYYAIHSKIWEEYLFEKKARKVEECHNNGPKDPNKGLVIDFLA